VKLKVAWIGKTKEPAIASLTEEYLKRISRYADVDSAVLRDEKDLLEKFGAKAKNRSTLVLLDSRGKEFSSEQFAKFLGDHQERNPLPIVFAIGDANGFSAETRSASQHVISMGRMTLAHELARVVLLEQIYRGFTILKGHPYHSGH